MADAFTEWFAAQRLTWRTGVAARRHLGRCVQVWSRGAPLRDGGVPADHWIAKVTPCRSSNGRTAQTPHGPSLANHGSSTYDAIRTTSV